MAITSLPIRVPVAVNHCAYTADPPSVVGPAHVITNSPRPFIATCGNAPPVLIELTLIFSPSGVPLAVKRRA